MTPSQVWTNLVSTLQNNPTLSAYVKYVYEGYRYNIEPENLPCLMLEPVQNNLKGKDLNVIKDIYLDINLYGFSTNNYNQFPKTIVGDNDYKGILDIENDVRGCLISSYTLGDSVIDTIIQPSKFDQTNIEKYPVRGFLLPLRFLYRQINGV